MALIGEVTNQSDESWINNYNFGVLFVRTATQTLYFDQAYELTSFEALIRRFTGDDAQFTFSIDEDFVEVYTETFNASTLGTSLAYRVFTLPNLSVNAVSRYDFKMRGITDVTSPATIMSWGFNDGNVPPVWVNGSGSSTGQSNPSPNLGEDFNFKVYGGAPQPPNKPVVPSPSSGASGIILTPTLEWEAG